MTKHVPDDCLLTLSAEITPELARRFPDRMNLLFQAQLVSHSVTDLESALRLLLDLSREAVPWDHAALFWRDDANSRFVLREHRGDLRPETVAALRREILGDDVIGQPRALLLDKGTCSAPAAAASLSSAGIGGVMSVPVYVRDRVAGALCLMRAEGEPGFVPEEAHLLRVFSFSFEPVLDALVVEDPRDHAFTDRLTGLFSRRYFDQQLEREMDRGRRTNEPVGLVLVQVRGLDRVRHAYGQSAADALLHEAGQALSRTCRKSDTLSRLDSTLYGIILPRTGKEQLAQAAQRLFASVDAPFLTDLLGEGGADVSFSMGAVAYPDDAYTPETLLEAAHAALDEVGDAGVPYFQFPALQTGEERDELLDPTRLGLLRDPAADPDRLLRLFVRVCLDTVPADRVSVLVRDGDELVIQVAYGFEGQEEIIKASRVPLTDRSVTGWVAQRKEPVLVTGEADLERLPASHRPSYRHASFISFPLVHEDRVLGVLHFSNRTDGGPFTPEDLERFRPVGETLARFLALSRGFSAARDDYLYSSLSELVDAAEQQVPGMAGHSREVSRLAVAMARHLGYDSGQLERIRISSRLHDLGKVSYRAPVLAEPRALSSRERDLAQRHPLFSWKFLEGLPLNGIDPDAVLYHHEREDGSGYLHKPSEEVPESAKILAVADVYQALVSHRPYRPAVSRQDALRYLETHQGTLFAPRAIEALQAVVTEDGSAG